MSGDYRHGAPFRRRPLTRPTGLGCPPATPEQRLNRAVDAVETAVAALHLEATVYTTTAADRVEVARVSDRATTIGAALGSVVRDLDEWLTGDARAEDGQ
jgi:hypothetical protein